jgi:hypothetical protein
VLEKMNNWYWHYYLARLQKTLVGQGVTKNDYFCFVEVRHGSSHSESTRGAA